MRSVPTISVRQRTCHCAGPTRLVRSGSRITCAECHMRVPAKALRRAVRASTDDPAHRLAMPDSFTVVGAKKL